MSPSVRDDPGGDLGEMRQGTTSRGRVGNHFLYSSTLM
jgi:hypothetical protein